MVSFTHFRALAACNANCVTIVDERDLAKLVSCVFLNAIKFTERGKIALRASLSPKSRSIVVNITDTGPGIPEAFIPYLFKAFSREDDSLTRQKEGLGLGLLVAKGLARRVGGDLVCVRSDTSGPRRGTEFELRVPITAAEAASGRSSPLRTSTPYRPHADSSPVPSRQRQTPNPSRRQTSQRKKTPTPVIQSREVTPRIKQNSPLPPSSPAKSTTITQKQPTPTRRLSTKKALTFDRNLATKYPLTFLVAEDNNINRKLLINMLSKLGYSDVYEAENGAEAVRQMSIDRRAQKEKTVDVVLMDLWMPKLDGYEATERIFAAAKERRTLGKPYKDDDDRARRKKSLTILAVSADVTDTAVERANAVGMAGYLSKPYTLLDLERLILDYGARSN